MKEYEIWVEGFSITGNHANASLLNDGREGRPGKIQANSFNEAIETFMKIMPDYKRGDTYTDWGCRLFDNEADARKSFG